MAESVRHVEIYIGSLKKAMIQMAVDFTRSAETLADMTKG